MRQHNATKSQVRLLRTPPYMFDEMHNPANPEPVRRPAEQLYAADVFFLPGFKQPQLNRIGERRDVAPVTGAAPSGSPSTSGSTDAWRCIARRDRRRARRAARESARSKRHQRQIAHKAYSTFATVIAQSLNGDICSIDQIQPMPNVVLDYFNTLAATFGRGWNRFWFTPSRPTTLGLIRLVVGVIALHWYWSYGSDLDLLFGPAGVINDQALESWRGPETLNNKPVFTLFDWIEDSSTLVFFYWLGFGVIALFAAGVLSRVTTVLALVFVLSLIHRGPMLVRPFEDVLAMTMFYLCFGANGGAFSVDALSSADATATRPLMITGPGAQPSPHV